MMDTITKIKAAVTAALAVLSAKMGILAVPMLVLVTLNIVDYFTGLGAAPYRGETRNSDKGFRGIWKKVCMWILVGIGAAVDWLILYASNTIGLQINLHFLVAALVAVWLICNEIISVLENVRDIGVDLPPFLLKIVEQVKDAAENKADTKNKEREAK